VHGFEFGFVHGAGRGGRPAGAQQCLVLSLDLCMAQGVVDGLLARSSAWFLV
jgi:hypothetical protein